MRSTIRRKRAVRKIWHIVVYGYAAKNSVSRAYLLKTQDIRWMAARQFFAKAGMLICRLSIAGIITYSCGTWAVRQAFIQRGYKAYGGEYIAAALVFCIAYIGLGSLQDHLHKRRAGRPEEGGQM